MALEYHKPLDK